MLVREARFDTPSDLVIAVGVPTPHAGSALACAAPIDCAHHIRAAFDRRGLTKSSLPNPRASLFVQTNQTISAVYHVSSYGANA